MKNQAILDHVIRMNIGVTLLEDIHLLYVKSLVKKFRPKK